MRQFPNLLNSDHVGLSPVNARHPFERASVANTGFAVLGDHHGWIGCFDVHTPFALIPLKPGALIAGLGLDLRQTAPYKPVRVGIAMLFDGFEVCVSNPRITQTTGNA